MENKKVELIKRIEEIRVLLGKDDMHEAYNKLISLNEVDDDIDEYTCYFMNTIDLDIDLDKADDFEIDEENGTIVVEGALGGYVLAKVGDIEDTLKEIEKSYL